MFQREKRSCNGNNSFLAARSMFQRERLLCRNGTRSYNGNLRRKPNKQKKPVPEITPGRALSYLWKPETLEYQGFLAKRKCTIILSKLPCIGGELHQKRYFRKLRQSKGFRPQAGGFAHAFFTFLGCFECNQKRYFLIFINDEELLHWMLLTCKLRVNILTLGLFHISSASPIIML